MSPDISGLYRPFHTAILDGSEYVDLEMDTINATLVTPDYVVDPYHRDMNLSTIPREARVSTRTLTGKTVNKGAFDAADVTFDDVPADTRIKAIILWKDCGDHGLSEVGNGSHLIGYITGIVAVNQFSQFWSDAADPRLMFISDGNPIHIRWDGPPNYIFSLSPGYYAQYQSEAK